MQLDLRYLILELGFNGFTQKRTVNELLWRNNDPLIEVLKTTDVQKGGDPSLDPVINLAGYNFTRE